jgi:hypothetical protein
VKFKKNRNPRRKANGVHSKLKFSKMPDFEGKKR